jgi:hypothetical protein
MAGVFEGLEVLCLVSHSPAYKLMNHVFEIFAVHAKHLLGSMASLAASALSLPESF